MAGNFLGGLMSGFGTALNRMWGWFSPSGFGSGEKIRTSSSNIWNFLTFDDGVTEETPEMRAAYRKMLAEPMVKSALLSKVEKVALLPWQVHPPNPDDERDQMIARFVDWAADHCEGGKFKLLHTIILAGLIEGHSISEKVWRDDPIPRGEWKGLRTYRVLKGKDPLTIQIAVDAYRNVDALRGMTYNAGQLYVPQAFVLWTHIPLWENPLGMSDLRACYRACELKRVAWKLRGIYIAKYSAGGMMVGKYKRDEMIQTLLTALEDAMASSYVALPEGTSMELINLSTGTASDFKDFIADVDKEIYVSITRAFLQSLEGATANKAGSSGVHSDTADEPTDAIVAAVQEVLNSQFVPDLVDINFMGADFPRITLGAIDPAKLLQQAQLDKALQDLGLDLSKRATYRKYSADEPEGPDDILQSAAAKQAASMIGPDGEPMGPDNPDDDGGDGGDGDELNTFSDPPRALAVFAAATKSKFTGVIDVKMANGKTYKRHYVNGKQVRGQQQASTTHTSAHNPAPTTERPKYKAPSTPEEHKVERDRINKTTILAATKASPGGWARVSDLRKNGNINQRDLDQHILELYKDGHLSPSVVSRGRHHKPGDLIPLPGTNGRFSSIERVKFNSYPKHPWDQDEEPEQQAAAPEAPKAVETPKATPAPKPAKPAKPSIDDLHAEIAKHKAAGVKVGSDEHGELAKKMGQLTVAQLSDLKKKLGVKASGVKAELVKKISERVLEIAKKTKAKKTEKPKVETKKPEVKSDKKTEPKQPKENKANDLRSAVEKALKASYLSAEAMIYSHSARARLTVEVRKKFPDVKDDDIEKILRDISGENLQRKIASDPKWVAANKVWAEREASTAPLREKIAARFQAVIDAHKGPDGTPHRHAEELAKNLDGVMKRMTPKALERMNDAVKKMGMHNSPQELTAHVFPEGTDTLAQGTWGRRDGELDMDGDYYGGTLAHELTHAIDTEHQDLVLSRSDEWKQAWKEELVDTKPLGKHLTDYASTVPHEGFAEFGRALYRPNPHNNPYNEKIPDLKERFPKCYAYFKRHGLTWD